MAKSWRFWRHKFQRRAKHTLRTMKKKYKEQNQDFDEVSAEPKLVSLYLWNLSGGKHHDKGKKKKKPKKKVKVSRKGRTRSPPVSGYALYYVVSVSDEVTLLHPNSLEVCKIGRRQFDKSITNIWWPTEEAKANPEARNKFNEFCNRFKVADSMLAKMAELARREKMFKQKVVREAIADLKAIPLKDVPEYEIVKHDALKKWRDNQPTYKKRAAILIKTYKEKEMATKKAKKSDESSSAEASSSASPSSSASASESASASSSEAKENKVKKSKKGSKKSEKKSKKSDKKSKKEKSSKDKGGVKIPQFASANACLIRLLMKYKGKTVAIKDIQKHLMKERERVKEYPEKMLHKKGKIVKAWAEKNNLKFKESSKGMQIS